MIAYILVYTFLASLMGAIVYVIGIPWSTPRSRNDNQRSSQKDISKAHS